MLGCNSLLLPNYQWQANSSVDCTLSGVSGSLGKAAHQTDTDTDANADVLTVDVQLQV